MGICRINIRAFILVITIILCLNGLLFSQGKYQNLSSGVTGISYEKSFLRTSLLIKNDNQKLLDFENFYPVGDSIQSFCWKGKMWFLFSAKSNSNNKKYNIELFNFNMSNNKIAQITNQHFNKADCRLFTMKIFNDKMFLTTNFSEKDNVWNFGMLLIDNQNDNSERYILVKEKAVVREIYAQSDTLHIIVQPKIAKLNWSYYFTFWMPRERPPKYEWINNGVELRFVYDKDFNIIRRE
jgi:hypothetical protein